MAVVLHGITATLRGLSTLADGAGLVHIIPSLITQPSTPSRNLRSGRVSSDIPCHRVSSRVAACRPSLSARVGSMRDDSDLCLPETSPRNRAAPPGAASTDRDAALPIIIRRK